MHYRRLGSTGLKVSPFTLGTMMLGGWGNRDVDECVRLVHRALDAGINLIDTANVYAAGESEEIVGKAIRDRRQQVVLATKVFGKMGDGPNERGLSRKAIQEQVEASLRRLGTEVIDLYQIHRPDPTTPWEETLSTLDLLVRQGKVRYVGCSTNHYQTEDPWQQKLEAWQLVETLWIADRRGWERFVSLQPPYSLLRRTMEAEHFPVTRRFGLGNLVWSPLEGGWLAGKYRVGIPNPGDSPRARNWVGELGNPKFERRLEVIEDLAARCAARGVSMARFALAWALHHPDVTSVILGPRTVEQLDDCLAALDLSLTPEDLARVDALVPPGTSVL